MALQTLDVRNATHSTLPAGKSVDPLSAGRSNVRPVIQQIYG